MGLKFFFLNVLLCHVYVIQYVDLGVFSYRGNRFFEGVTDPGGCKNFTSENLILQFISLRLIVKFSRVQFNGVQEDVDVSVEWVKVKGNKEVSHYLVVDLNFSD